MASGFRDDKAAEAVRGAFAQAHPEFEFRVVSTVSAHGDSSVMQAVFAGEDLARAEAAGLLQAIRKADFINGAYITQQTFNCAGSSSSAAQRTAPVRKAARRASGVEASKY